MYKIRLGGTNEFLSEIDRKRDECNFVKGWDNSTALIFYTYEAAKSASDAVGEIEGFHNSIEEVVAEEAPADIDMNRSV